MNKDQMVFALNKNEKIIIDLSYSIEEILPFDPICISFSFEATVKLAKGHILPTLREFKNVLKKAMDEQSTWPDKINEDIGCIWNKVLKDDIPDENIVLLQGETVKYWSGQRYIAWSTTGNMKPHTTTWIYNNPEGNIIFHITPVLKNILTASKKKYDIFMQSYKPFLMRTIPKNVAQEWLNQIDDALKIVESKLKK